MCGIAGIIAFEGGSADLSEQLLVAMRDVMEHRGPDHAGVWLAPDRRAGLAHRRLSIIDLSEAASQPMSNADGSLWISYNGEIYNHAEIRAELEALGRRRWRTDHSDTEVILQAFEEWGIGCLDRFRGMFAFALWDESRKELWLVRDRVGIKPLYYSIDSRRIAFASEIKALLQGPVERRVICEEALYHYLTFLATPAPLTLFEGIHKLAPGSWLRVGSDGKTEERRYWEVWDHVEPLTSLSEEEIAERLLEELREAVRYRKVSDVPVGVFLSGGIDSSTIAALFGNDSSLNTFMIGYEGDYDSYRNETEYARLMAARVGARHHERMLTVGDLVDFMPRMVHLQDEPIGDPVCVPLYYVSKLARDAGVIVCLVGEGADELFFGYPHWQRFDRLQAWNGLPVPAAVKRLGLRALGLMGRAETVYYEWLRRGARGLPVFWGGAYAFSEVEKRRLLSPRLQQDLGGLTSWEAVRPVWERFRERAWDRSNANWMSFMDLNLRLPELLLMRVDKMSMGVSLESRVPFLDHKLVELAFSIPGAVKFKRNSLKPMLKRSVRSMLPAEIVDRPKQGFGVPVQEWFEGELGEVASRQLAELCAETDLFDARVVSELIGRKERRMSLKAWPLLNLAAWWKEYVAR